MTSQQHKPQTKKRAWWQTDCEFCNNVRLILFWLVLMLLVYFYVWN